VTIIVIHIFAAKIQLYFDIHKFVNDFLDNYL
jgi:hypothetical protein